MNKLEGYKHKRTNDVGFMPLSVQATDEGLNVKGWWFLLSNETLMGYDNFTIKKDDIPMWEFVNTSS